MKFLCLPCDEVMEFAERQIPGDGTLAAVFGCPSCDREVAMLTNPMETQFVSSMGVEIGGRKVPEQPMELVRGNLAEGGEDAFDDADLPPASAEAAAPADASAPDGGSAASTAGADPGAPPGRVEWTDDAVERLGRVPSFVRGMVKRIYTDYARERGIPTITPAIMDRARSDLGLEGM